MRLPAGGSAVQRLQQTHAAQGEHSRCQVISAVIHPSYLSTLSRTHSPTALILQLTRQPQQPAPHRHRAHVQQVAEIGEAAQVGVLGRQRAQHGAQLWLILFGLHGCSRDRRLVVLGPGVVQQRYTGAKCCPRVAKA